MKITPGPWKLETAPGGPNAGWTLSVEKARDASLKGYRYIILAQRSAIPGDEFAANARAFAEVPEMIALLEALDSLDMADSEDWGYDRYEDFWYQVEKLRKRGQAILRRIEGGA